MHSIHPAYQADRIQKLIEEKIQKNDTLILMQIQNQLELDGLFLMKEKNNEELKKATTDSI